MHTSLFEGFDNGLYFFSSDIDRTINLSLTSINAESMPGLLLTE